MAKPLYLESELAADMAFVAKKLGIPPDELRASTEGDYKTYYKDFPNWQAKISFLRAIYRTLLKLGIKLKLKAH